MAGSGPLALMSARGSPVASADRWASSVVVTGVRTVTTPPRSLPRTRTALSRIPRLNSILTAPQASRMRRQTSMTTKPNDQGMRQPFRVEEPVRCGVLRCVSPGPVRVTGCA